MSLGMAHMYIGKPNELIKEAVYIWNKLYSINSSCLIFQKIFTGAHIVNFCVSPPVLFSGAMTLFFLEPYPYFLEPSTLIPKAMNKVFRA